VPCLRTSAPVSRFWILVLMRSLISDGFNCMIFLCARRGPSMAACATPMRDSGSQMVCHRLQLAGHRAVDHRIADNDPGPADERRIDAGGGLDLLAETSLQRALESGKLSLAQRKCAGDLRPRQTFGGVLEVCEKVANVREQPDSIGA